MSTNWSFHCFRSRAWSRGYFGNCHWLLKRIRWLARLQSQEKPGRLQVIKNNLASLNVPLLLGRWIPSDPRSDVDVNNDVNSLYVEIIDKNRTYYKCTIWGQKLSRRRRLKTLLDCVHSKGEEWHEPITILCFKKDLGKKSKFWKQRLLVSAEFQWLSLLFS